MEGEEAADLAVPDGVPVFLFGAHIDVAWIQSGPERRILAAMQVGSRIKIIVDGRTMAMERTDVDGPSAVCALSPVLAEDAEWLARRCSDGMVEVWIDFQDVKYAGRA